MIDVEVTSVLTTTQKAFVLKPTSSRIGLQTRLALTVVAALMAYPGCDDGATEPGGQSSYLGTYTLREVVPNSVPTVMLQTSAYKLEATEGDFVVERDFSFRFRVRFRETIDGTVRTSEWTQAGTYVLVGPDDENQRIAFQLESNGEIRIIPNSANLVGSDVYVYAAYVPEGVLNRDVGSIFANFIFANDTCREGLFGPHGSR